ncbi:unnamed protein product [Laminaria digitata]
MVDIRYEKSTEQVLFHRCDPEYAKGLTEPQRDHSSAVAGPLCELAWKGVLREYGAL